MEEKERYEYFFGTNTVKDNINKEFLSYKRVIDTLNQQDKELSKLRASYQQVKEENSQLKQQLTEKEKEIEDLKAQRRIYLNRSVEECNKITDLEFELQHKDQDKISFAVDVLKIAQDYVQQYVNDFDDKNDCLCAIDKQIKQLTHQHEDKGENK